MLCLKRNYLNTIQKLPFKERSLQEELSLNAEYIEKELDNDLYGLFEAKRLIMNCMIMKNKNKSICLSGKEGVGKRSLALATAKALKMKVYK